MGYILRSLLCIGIVYALSPMERDKLDISGALGLTGAHLSQSGTSMAGTGHGDTGKAIAEAIMAGRPDEDAAGTVSRAGAIVGAIASRLDVATLTTIGANAATELGKVVMIMFDSMTAGPKADSPPAGGNDAGSALHHPGKTH